MSSRKLLIAAMSVALFAAPARAQQQRTVDSLAAAVRALQAQVDSLARPAGAPAAPTAPRTGGAYMNVAFSGLTVAGWSTERNVRALQVGDHDPRVRGFTIPNGELSLDGTVDPHFKGYSNVVFKLDENGETGVELEELYFLTTSLPANLQIKGGQFLAEFGRQNQQHPHAWAFADQPLVVNRMFGAEGMRSQGMRLSWLAPTPFYTEASLGVMNSAGGTTASFRSEESGEIHGGLPIERDVRAARDLLLVPRLSTSFDLGATQTVVLGASGAFGPNNSGPDARTAVYGADLYWKWKSATAHQGFPFVSLQAEAMTRRYEAAARPSAEDETVELPAETLRDGGAYAQLLWGIRPMLVAGLRGEYASGRPAAGDIPGRLDRSRFSPNLTWYPSEFSKLRLQYNYDHRRGIGNDHSLWLQVEFLLGAHAAHKF